MSWLISLLGYLKFKQHANQVFSRTKYQPTDKDIKALAQNMALLEKRGLSNLNQRLIDANTKIFDTIAEHNVAAMLIRHFGISVPIEYELPGHGNRPVDFRVQLNDHTYWLQMKRFSNLERENRQNNMINQIKRIANQLYIRKFFDCKLGENFIPNDVPLFVHFLQATAPTSEDGVQYDYPTSDNVRAQVQYWEPTNVTLQGLTLGSASDIAMVNVTGLSSDQIRASVSKAATAFTQAVDDNNVNLVIAEADRQHDIDIAEACFGTEEELFSRDGRHEWTRQCNGVFSEMRISENVAGLITLRRHDQWKPISDYVMSLYINENHIVYLPAIQTAFPIQQVIHYNMRPE